MDSYIPPFAIINLTHTIIRTYVLIHKQFMFAYVKSDD
ncbi:hypothetical protein QFZ73_004507 [Peribacillus sp. V2I11]|nr:hypothetical protein [Peribacillus sp. V2I11]